jgi:4-methylaminobutanoate oxidase (formaldehyde-forming)
MNKNLSFGYIISDISNEKLAKSKFYIEVEKKKYLANLLLKPLKQNNYKNI